MTLSLTPTASETTGDLRDALKPFAKLADIYDVWDDPGSDELRLTTEHVSEESPDESFTIGDLRRARTALATPTTPHPTEDVAALRALRDLRDEARRRKEAWHTSRDNSLWAGCCAADMAFDEAAVAYVRTQLAGADTTAAPGSDGEVEDELREALGKILALFTDDGYIDCSLTQQIGVYKEARATLARRSTPATGGAARLDHGAVARIIRKHIRLDRFPYADSSLNYESVDAAATAVLAALDPQPQAASEGVREAVQSALTSFVQHTENTNGLYRDGGFDAIDWRRRDEVISAILAAITPAGRGADAGGWRPPEGWRLVPEAPTEAMTDAWWDRTPPDLADMGGGDIAACYRAMLAAAPTAPTAPGEDR